jgi:YVTN family beta-propeller protein
MAITPDGRRLFAIKAAGANTVVVVQIPEDIVKTEIHVQQDPASLVVQANGRHLYVTNQSSNTVSVISVAHNKVEDTVRVGQAPGPVVTQPAHHERAKKHDHDRDRRDDDDD